MIASLDNEEDYEGYLEDIEGAKEDYESYLEDKEADREEMEYKDILFYDKAIRIIIIIGILTYILFL